MKKIGLYFGSFVTLSLLFCLCYYTSYKNALKDFNRKAKEQESSLYSELERVSEENKSLLNRLAQQEAEAKRNTEETNPSQDSAAVGVLPRNTVLPTVSYIEETYNTVTNQLDSVERTAPGFLIGMTRDELTSYISNYMENLSLAEYEAGLLSYDIISFSENKVVLRKTYDASKVPYKFFINISDGMVTVFYSDLESVYEYTHIPAVDLTEEDRIALTEGIYVKNREELYSILEGFPVKESEYKGDLRMKSKVFDTIVVGGGASGLTAAIFAARKGCRVLVLEQKEKLCKKVYATGNGKCNFTNKDWQANCFRGSDYSLAEPILRSFSLEDTLHFFKEIGIYPKERNGYFYPNSEQAASVAECLVREAERCGVRCLTGIKVNRVYKEADTVFGAETDAGEFRGKSIVLATGGKASPVHGSDGSGYPFAKSFGHTIIPPLPAIVQLKAEGKFFKTLAGVRTDGRVTLHIGTEMYTEEGELLFAAYGLSGIPVMQVSRYASVALYEKKNVTAELDLFPAISEMDLADEITRRFCMMKDNTAEEALAGLCNHKLNYVMLQLCGLESTKKASTYGKKEAMVLAEKFKHFTVKITDTNGFEQAQACTGGVPLTELTEHMESKSVTGLFITGELTDIDGTCGGYNLQWAWSSGAAAGKEIGGRYASDSTTENKH